MRGSPVHVRKMIGSIPWVKPAYYVWVRASIVAKQRFGTARRALSGRMPDMEYDVTSMPRWGHGSPPHEGLYRVIDQGRRSYAEWLRAAASAEGLRRIAMNAPAGVEPRWNQGWFPAIDAAALYVITGALKPATFLEVGSGESTKFCRRAIRDYGLTTRIVSVDPQPRAEVDVLCDEVIRRPVETLDPAEFDSLDAGDVLFIDSSHRVFMNSDVTMLWLDVLPRLKPGVVVHVHDVFLPYDYPLDWSRRFYSEQYLLAASLLADPSAFELIMATAFVTNDAELPALLAPLWRDVPLPPEARRGWSFWFRVGADATGPQG